MSCRPRLSANFERLCRSPYPSSAVTTSRRVVHSPCGSILVVNVRPALSTFAGAVAEISVARRKVSRS